MLADKKLKRTVGDLQGEQLTRTPKGFPTDHPGESLLRQKQWYLENTLDGQLLTSPKLLPELVRHFELMAPMVEFFNQALVRKPRPQKMMFAALALATQSAKRPGFTGIPRQPGYLIALKNLPGL